MTRRAGNARTGGGIFALKIAPLLPLGQELTCRSEDSREFAQDFRAACL